MKLLHDLWDFLKTRKKFWLIPLIDILLFFGFLIAFSSGSAIAPFIYTLFWSHIIAVLVNGCLEHTLPKEIIHQKNNKKQNMSEIIIGISAFYHDSAACIIKDGEIIAAAQEERFTRKKHDSNFPSHALSYVIDQLDVDVSKINHVAF